MHPPNSNSGEGRPPGHPWLWMGITGLAALMIVGFSAFVIGLMGTIERQDRQLRTLLDSAGSAMGGSGWADRDAERAAFEVLSSPAAEIIRITLPELNGAGGMVALVDRSRGKGALMLSGYRGGATGSVILRMQNDGMERFLGVFLVPDSMLHLYSFNFPPHSDGTLVVRPGHTPGNRGTIE